MHTHKMHSSGTSHNLISVCLILSHFTIANKMEISSRAHESSAAFDWKNPKKGIIYYVIFLTNDIKRHKNVCW